MIDRFILAKGMTAIRRTNRAGRSSQVTNQRYYGASLGGTMGKGRETQIILKSDQRTIILELGLGENSKPNQVAGMKTERSSKAMFL
jgi:hypothetical protein